MSPVTDCRISIFDQLRSGWLRLSQVDIVLPFQSSHAIVCSVAWDHGSLTWLVSRQVGQVHRRGSWTGDGVGSDVSLHVQREVIAARERPLATRTLERPVAGMLAVVARQLVGTRELPLTPRPLARVGFLPRVSPQVCLEVRAFVVRLRAPVERALVDDLPGHAAAQGGPRASTSSSGGRRRRVGGLLRLEDLLVAGRQRVVRRSGRRGEGRVVTDGGARRRWVRHRQRAAEALRTDVVVVVTVGESVDERAPVTHLLRRRRRRRQADTGLVRQLSSAAEVARVVEECRLTVIADRHLGICRHLAVHAVAARRLLHVAHHFRLSRHGQVVEEGRGLVGRREDLLLALDLRSVVRVQTQLRRDAVVDDEVQVQQIVVGRLQRRLRRRREMDRTDDV